MRQSVHGIITTWLFLVAFVMYNLFFWQTDMSKRSFQIYGQRYKNEEYCLVLHNHKETLLKLKGASNHKAYHACFMDSSWIGHRCFMVDLFLTQLGHRHFLKVLTSVQVTEQHQKDRTRYDITKKLLYRLQSEQVSALNFKSQLCSPD